jgi:hypothetical protein
MVAFTNLQVSIPTSINPACAHPPSLQLCRSPLADLWFPLFSLYLQMLPTEASIQGKTLGPAPQRAQAQCNPTTELLELMPGLARPECPTVRRQAINSSRELEAVKTVDRVTFCVFLIVILLLYWGVHCDIYKCLQCILVKSTLSIILLYPPS